MLHSQTNPQPTPNANPPVSEPERRKRIRELNDLFRRQDQPGAFMLGEFYKTPGIRAMGWGDQWAIIEKVKRYEHFEDAEGEHDFGAFSHKGQRIFWRIDYVDPKFHKMSDDPSDPQRTVRMLCIYLAEEQYVQ